MKKYISISLIFLYLSVLIVPLNPVIHYVLHKKYYVEVLCENKDKPKMHCNGKCHLKKEIKAKQSGNSNPYQPIPIPKSEREIFPVFIKLDSNYCFVIEEKLLSDNLYKLPYFKDIYMEVNTPPPKKSLLSI